MDKLTIVMNNYIDVECDANTTPRQAYERGFRRATKKCETVMHSRKIEKEKVSIENDRLMAENAKLRELCAEMFEAVKCCCGEWCTKTASNCDNNECGWHKCYVALRELGIKVDDETDASQ